MKKFRFIGTPTNYKWRINPIKDEIYDIFRCKSSFGEGWVDSIFDNLANSSDWQEVDDDLNPVLIKNQKPLHKETDLGYFVGLYIQLQGNEHANPDIEWAITQAKKLINQLDNETERN